MRMEETITSTPGIQHGSIKGGRELDVKREGNENTVTGEAEKHKQNQKFKKETHDDGEHRNLRTY